MSSDSKARYAIQRSYDDFDHLAADMRQWDLDLRQIDCGLFQGEVLQIGIGDTHIAEGRFDRVFEQKGAPPAGLHTIGIPANQNVKFIWRGQQVNGNNLVVFPRGAELASVSSPDFHVYTCSFPERLLASLSEGLQVGELDELRGTNEVIDCRSDSMIQLQNHARVLCESARRNETIFCERNIRNQLTFELPRQLLLIVAASEGVRVPASSQKREFAVARAQVYIERHSREPISAKDLCRVAGVSQRTLEYAFDERFGVTPKAFLLTYRLNMVRKELRNSDHSATKVVEVANGYGFWHMGRFAASYRQLFQELPSDTLSQSNVVPDDE